MFVTFLHSQCGYITHQDPKTISSSLEFSAEVAFLSRYCKFTKFRVKNPQLASVSNGQLAGQKRPHSDIDDAQERDAKRISTGNQPTTQKIEATAVEGIPELTGTPNPPVTTA